MLWGPVSYSIPTKSCARSVPNPKYKAARSRAPR